MEHTRFVGLDIHKERISIAVAESGRSCAVEYLGEISNDPVAIGRLCDRLGRPSKTLRFATRLARAAMVFTVNLSASAIAAM
jgi:transposase